MALTDKRKKFCEEYLKDGNGTRSAIAAGYSEISARVQAVKILEDEEVVEYIKERQEEFKNECNITKHNIIERLNMIADRSSIEEKNFNNAIKAYAEISKLLRFYEAEKIDVKDDRVNINYNKPKK